MCQLSYSVLDGQSTDAYKFRAGCNNSEHDMKAEEIVCHAFSWFKISRVRSKFFFFVLEKLKRRDKEREWI